MPCGIRCVRIQRLELMTCGLIWKWLFLWGESASGACKDILIGRSMWVEVEWEVHYQLVVPCGGCLLATGSWLFCWGTPSGLASIRWGSSTYLALCASYAWC
jgi:hypothetical protein